MRFIMSLNRCYFFKILIIKIFLLLHSTYSFGETSVIKGPYEIFYSVFNSSFISPETAKLIGFKRAKNTALINISIRKNISETVSIEKKASSLIASAYNLIHKKPLEFTEIIEPGAIYYLSEFKISNDNEKMIISAEVIPEGSQDPINISFQHHFYIN